MATFERAVELAARAHAGQRDKGGGPYLTHPLRVWARVAEEAPEDETVQIVAVLHDAVEDSDLTLEDLRAEGFSQSVLNALERMTHRPSETYAEYVVACAGDPLARRVKLADLGDNSRLDRALLRPDREADDLARQRRYVLAYKFLTDQIDETEYRRRMAEPAPARTPEPQ